MSETAVDILLVEDNSGDALLFTEMLIDCPGHYDVARATRISEALALMDAQRFDLIVMDLNLPDERGIRALGRIRAKTNLPIIILTGSFDKEMEYKAKEEGVRYYFKKGKVEVSELWDALSHCLAAEESKQATPMKNLSPL